MKAEKCALRAEYREILDKQIQIEGGVSDAAITAAVEGSVEETFKRMGGPRRFYQIHIYERRPSGARKERVS